MRFKSKLRSEQLTRTEFKLIDPLIFGDLIVPAGFETNYASIHVFHNILLFPIYALFAGYGNYAATVHDYLYQTAMFSRKECDRIFYLALRDEGVARWRAWMMWAGVRIGGASSYKGLK